MPMIKKIRQITRNRKKRNFAIPAAAAAMPVNPNNAATSAMTRKITAQRNMFFTSYRMNRARHLRRVFIVFKSTTQDCDVGKLSKSLCDFLKQPGTTINVARVHLNELRAGLEFLAGRFRINNSAGSDHGNCRSC